MIIISASMPRSASRFLHFATIDLLSVTGNLHSTELIKDIKKTPLKRFDFIEINKLIKASKYTSFAVRTHQKPHFFINHYLKKGAFIATYMYRDPRDVICSALELGCKIRNSGNTQRHFGVGPYKNVAKLFKLEDAILWFKWILYPRWKLWMKAPNTIHFRYEDFVANPFTHLKNVADFIEIEVSDSEIAEIIENHNNKKGSSEYQTLGGGNIFNKGIPSRFTKDLSPKQITFINKKLEKELLNTGYLSGTSKD